MGEYRVWKVDDCTFFIVGDRFEGLFGGQFRGQFEHNFRGQLEVGSGRKMIRKVRGHASN